MNSPFKGCHTFLLILLPCICSAAIFESKLVNVTGSASARLAYDSRVFGVSSSTFTSSQGAAPSSGINGDELESEDDFILTFSPALHFTSKLGLLKISGSAGVGITQYFINDSKSFISPSTNLTFDFDDSLGMGLKRRISNNAKIRFESTFDLGQEVGVSVLDQELTSYLYLLAGFNVRYNYSKKFAVGGGTSYSYRWYQQEESFKSTNPNLDFSTLPLHLDAFYIYSEKLDFFSTYNYQRNKAYGSAPTRSELTSSANHGINIGAQGDFTSKSSGVITVGYTLIDFDDAFANNQDNLTTSLTFKHKHNSKTNSSYSLTRQFSPTAQGSSTFSTSISANLNHKFTEKWSGSATLSGGLSEYTYPRTPSGGAVPPSKSKNFGFSLGSQHKVFQKFTLDTGYNFTRTDNGDDAYNRHVVFVQSSTNF